MVILRMSEPVSGDFECELINLPEGFSKDLYNLVRPCERYKELYKSCKSLKNKLYQYYIYGEVLDCKHHLENYNSCLEYRKTKNLNLLDKVIQYESNMVKVRMETVKQNKAWEMRDKPPDDFQSPLPDFIVKKQVGSVLADYDLNRDK